MTYTVTVRYKDDPNNERRLIDRGPEDYTREIEAQSEAEAMQIAEKQFHGLEIINANLKERIKRNNKRKHRERYPKDYNNVIKRERRATR